MPVPRLSILLAGGSDPDRAAWSRTVGSLLAQRELAWELVAVGGTLADEGRPVGDPIPDDRVRQRPSSGRGLVADLNDARQEARGEWVMTLDPGDVLHPDALSAIASAAAGDASIDVVYSDEIVHDDQGEATFLKPAWSPERLRSQHYLGRLVACRRALVDEVGGYRPELAGAHEHDLALRVTERARRIHHLPAPLVSRRSGEPGGRDVPVEQLASARRRAVRDQFTRLDVEADVEDGPVAGTVRVHRRPRHRPTVSVVLPTAGTGRPVWGVSRPFVERLVESLFETASDVELVIVVDPATPPAVVEGLEATGATLVPGATPFNFSRCCNVGVAASRGELVVLLNDDMVVEQHGWIDELAGYFVEPDVGIVGPRLLFADGTVQHAGVLLNEHPLHIFSGFEQTNAGPFGLLQVAREVGAVTGACLVTRRALWDRLGGLDETFAVAFNDIDYCLRARALGQRIVWTPNVTLYHFESQTRGRTVAQAEIDLMFERWHDELAADPYGNPNFAPRQAVWVARDEMRRWPWLRRRRRGLPMGAR